MRWSYVLISGGLLFFLLYKILRFDALGYSFNDMYAFVQMSCSWMDGRPFMYDNIWSYHHRIHNYYTVLLWGPICYYAGAKGLFWVQVLLLLSACWLVNRQLIRSKTSYWPSVAVMWVIILGPVSFWLNDHPNIGWHTELTYLPAALFWASVQLPFAKKKAGKMAAWVAGTFLVLIKEDGAVLALLIQGVAFALGYLVEAREATSFRQLLTGLLRQRRLWVMALGWSVVFVVGMIWLAAKNGFAEPRLRNALTLMAIHGHDRVFLKQMFVLLGQSLLLQVPVAGLLFWVTQALPLGQRVMVGFLWSFGIGVLILLNIVQSAHYIESPIFYLVSLTWPPRYVLLWAFSASFVFLMVRSFAEVRQMSVTRFAPFGLAGLWLVQLPLLSVARPDLPGVAEWKAAFIGPPGAHMRSEFLDPADLRAIRALADDLPPRSNVFAFDYVVPYFHKHYGIWPTGNHWRTADVAIMARPDIQHLSPWLNKLLPPPRDSVPLNYYTIYCRPGFVNLVKQSLKRSRASSGQSAN